MADKFFRYIPLFFATSIVVAGIHGLAKAGNSNLLSHCMMLWLVWFVLLLLRVSYEFAVTLSNGDSPIHLSVLEPLILIPLSFLLIDIVGTHIDELTIKPIWVCAMTGGLIVMGAIRLSEMILSRISDPLMSLMFRTSRKVVSRRHVQNIPVVCRSCFYCTAHTHLLCAIRPLGPEHPRSCHSFKARKNEQVL